MLIVSIDSNSASRFGFSTNVSKYTDTAVMKMILRANNDRLLKWIQLQLVMMAYMSMI